MTSPWELRQSRDHVAFRGPAGLGGASRRVARHPNCCSEPRHRTYRIFAARSTRKGDASDELSKSVFTLAATSLGALSSCATFSAEPQWLRIFTEHRADRQLPAGPAVPASRYSASASVLSAASCSRARRRQQQLGILEISGSPDVSLPWPLSPQFWRHPASPRHKLDGDRRRRNWRGRDRGGGQRADEIDPALHRKHARRQVAPCAWVLTDSAAAEPRCDSIRADNAQQSCANGIEGVR